MGRKRLLWQLYPPFAVITIVSLAAATGYFSYVFRNFHLDQTRSELRTLAGVALPQVAGALEQAGPGQVNAVAKRLGRAGGDLVRFTVIAPAGRVLGDSHQDPSVMEDHSDRQEIVAALRNGFGQSMRFSPTLGHKMMYVAIPVLRDEQPVAVVRTAIAVTAIDQTLREIYVSVAWAGFVIALCAAALSLLISRNISRPIVWMRQTAQLFAQGRFNTRVPAAGVSELDDLGGALNEMAVQLDDRILTITRQRNELETILSSMVEGVFAVDATGHIVNINKAAAQLLNIDPVQTPGRTVEEVVRNVALQQFVRDTLQGDQPTEGDVSFPADGERFFHVRGARLADPQGKGAGAVIVLSDVTRIHRLENLRRDFVANVSHELKTPVTSIQGFAEALQAGGVADPEQVQRYVSIIAKHA